MSWHSMQPGVAMFERPGYPGFIAYKDHGRHRHVVGDPVCPPEALEGLLGEFHKSRHPGRISFFHISLGPARALERIGYYINQIGEEAVIDLAGHTWRGRKKEDIRRQHNNAVRCGVEVVEGTGGGELLQEARLVSAEWLAEVKKGKKELCFAARPPSFGSRPGVRNFYGYQDGTMVAFVQFDPVCRHGQFEGYLPSVLRRRKQAPNGTQALIIKEAMEQFRAEGARSLYLGLLPAHNVEDLEGGQFRRSRFVAALFSWMGRSALANRFYPFKAVCFHKARYRASSRKVYMAFGAEYPITAMLSFGRLTGVI